MSKSKLEVGDVVQFQSGGRPLTVAEFIEQRYTPSLSIGLLASRSRRQCRVVGMNEDGLACELVVDEAAVKKYNDKLPYVEVRLVNGRTVRTKGCEY